jgi:hypothetical protein
MIMILDMRARGPARMRACFSSMSRRVLDASTVLEALDGEVERPVQVCYTCPRARPRLLSAVPSRCRSPVSHKMEIATVAVGATGPGDLEPQPRQGERLAAWCATNCMPAAGPAWSLTV